MKITTIAFALAIPFGLVIGATDASAHAHLRSASPPVDSTVAAPKAVEITFTEGVEPKFSSIVVKDAKGQQVDTGDVHPASTDGLKLAVGLKPLAPGAYTVVWHATSVDTHKTDGHFVFTVHP
jgi:methionine-rich copper-binding protein CopC